MKSKSSFTSKQMEGFLGKLSDLVGSLPSPEEKSRIDGDLRRLISYLEDVRRQLESVPTSSQLDGASIDRLRALMTVVDADPVLSRVLGLTTNGRRPVRRTPEPPVDAAVRAEEVAGELRTLSGEQVRARLTDRSYSVGLLRQIASKLGIRLRSKASRAVVIDTIAGKISNRRGYEILRHGGHA